MKHKFRVTGLGLKIDGVMIMPGSEVTLSAKPPSHWQRFGEYFTGQDEPKKKPAPQVETEEAPKRRGRPRRQEHDE